MKLPIVVKSEWILNLASRLAGFRLTGIEFIPFVVVVRKRTTKTIVNHETIHFRQMMELLVLGYYLVYLADYLRLRLVKRFGHKRAYWNIVLEREAYDNDDDLGYLATRRPFAWARKGA